MGEHGDISTTENTIYLPFTSIQCLYLHAICQSGGCVKLIRSSSSLLCSGGSKFLCSFSNTVKNSCFNWSNRRYDSRLRGLKYEKHVPRSWGIKKGWGITINLQLMSCRKWMCSIIWQLTPFWSPVHVLYCTQMKLSHTPVSVGILLPTTVHCL